MASKLRGKPPADIPKRLKLLMFSPAGVGKTQAAIQMPKPYIIDCEQGTTHYGPMIAEHGGTVFQTTSMDDAITEVRALLEGGHDFRTLVLDPFTPLYETELERGEREVGSEWGRHYGFAGKTSKRLFNLLSMLDMNVVVTAHAKGEYEQSGKDRVLIGNTFDGWKKLDYLFDLVLELQREGKKRFARVRKTRLVEFPDQERFEWSFDALAERYGAEALERVATPVVLASQEQTARLRKLIEALPASVPADTPQKWLDKANAETFEEMTAETVGACIAWCEKKLEEVKA